MNAEKDKLRDYSGSEMYNRKKALVTALLKWLECEFFGAFIFLCLFAMIALMGNAGNFIFGTLGLLCYIMVLIDFGLKEGSKAHIKNAVRGDNVRLSFGFLLGLTAMLPALISYIILLFSYMGIIGSAVLAFKILNFGLWGYINLFAPDMIIENVSAVLLIIYPIIMLIYPLTTLFSFKIGLNNENIADKIIYKK